VEGINVAFGGVKSHFPAKCLLHTVRDSSLVGFMYIPGIESWCTGAISTHTENKFGKSFGHGQSSKQGSVSVG